METVTNLKNESGNVGSADTTDAFKRAFRRHAGGVAVITADAGEGPVALTATSVASVNADPPTLVFSVSGLSSAGPAILAAKHIVVHFLSEERVDLAKLAATSGVDRFADPSMWSRLPTGEPIYKGVENWLRCRKENMVSTGTSTVVIAKVLEASAGGTATRAPLVYCNREWHRISAASLIAE